MTSLFSIIVFFIYLYGFGKLFFYRRLTLVETMAIGLAAIPIIALILNALHIPLDWRIFLGLALIAPCYQFLQWWRAGRSWPKIKLKRPSWQTLLVLTVFIFTIAIYCWGPFQYNWFEDDDPWSHAAGIKYIAIEKNLNAPDGTFQYLNPYPPGYDLLFGILHQISPSIYWTMKFFNGLIICLGFLFFYMFAQELTKNKSKAALATFFLALIPCYLTHFIWAHSLVITLFYPAFYFLLKTFKKKRYILPASICCAAIALVQPTQPIKFAIMAGLLIIAFASQKIKWKNISILLIATLSLIALWWGPVLTKTFLGKSQITFRAGEKITGAVNETSGIIPGLFSPNTGSATQAYSWEHFIFIADPNLINNPTGLTPMFFILAVIGIIFAIIKLLKKDDPDKPYLLTIIFWLTFTFLGINSMTFNLPIGLFAFRFWMLFAIPIVLLCAEAIYSLEKFLQFKWNKILVIALLLAATTRATFPFKWWFNTNEWSYGVHWASDEDIDGYIWMREKLPVNTKIFSFTDNVLVLGHDMRADFWTDDYKQRFENAFEKDINTLHTNLSEKKYDCIIISPRDIWKFGREKVNKKLKLFIEDPRFRLLFNNGAVKIFQVLDSSKL